MSCSRRDFLKNTFKSTLASALPLSAFRMLSPAEVKAYTGDASIRWVFLVDTQKCVGCGLCIVSCPDEAMSMIRRDPEAQPFIPDSSNHWKELRMENK